MSEYDDQEDDAGGRAIDTSGDDEHESDGASLSESVDVGTPSRLRRRTTRRSAALASTSAAAANRELPKVVVRFRQEPRAAAKRAMQSRVVDSDSGEKSSEESSEQEIELAPRSEWEVEALLESREVDSAAHFRVRRRPFHVACQSN